MKETSYDRVLAILALFGSEQVIWTVEEAAQTLQLPVSTTYRYFRSLAKAELITTYVTGQYVLGPAVIEYDRQMRLYDPLIQASRKEMANLADFIGEPTAIVLARLYHKKVMCVQMESRGLLPFAVSYERGRRMPLERGAAGKVVLANMSGRALRDALTIDASPSPAADHDVEMKSTQVKSGPVKSGQMKDAQVRDAQPAGKIDLDTLKEELRLIRAQGYAMTQGEIEKGARGLSVPVFSPDQRLEGSLSVIITDQREGVNEILQQLIRTRKNIEANLAIGALEVNTK